ncbi:MAG TPA: hypothetical protein VHB77_23420 [Planctomycetaceae bacterium]|nr:hypothetical protein [Planctomycetaceae bacterium]
MEERSRGRFLYWAVPVTLLAVPMLYVGSLGPMAWMDAQGWLGSDARAVAEIFYEPLGMVGERCAPFGSFLDWYVEVCRGGK